LSAVTTKEAGPKLILESMTRAPGPIDREPFLISTMRRAALGPRLTAVCGGPYVIAKKRLLLGRFEAEIEKSSYLIGECDRVATKDVIFQNARESPVYASVGSITPPRLSEIGVDAIELPPGNYHLIAISRINRDGRLIRGVAQDVVAICIDVRLIAGKDTELGDLPRRSLYFSRWRRRHVVFFKRFIQRQPA
jgi:hypothetical protein